MAMIDQVRFIKELREASGTAQERTTAMLRTRGWDRHLNAIPDDDFRGVVSRALEELAGEGARSFRRRKSIEAETREILDRVTPKFWDDPVGEPAEELVQRIPRETYFVASLGREFAREELLSELVALGELRQQFRQLREHHEKEARFYGREEAIFAELCRQKGVADEAA